ncbi:hypothetical protein [Sorangium sp. So ce233]|uniref:hypothetical protein n=1 Tax=Sorangium sp. So ce233 TaxID=3133290 RepID=UPI003F5D6397
MAIRTQSVPYGWTTDPTSLNAATRREFSAITVAIAETSSRTIVSAYLEIACRGNETSATAMTSRLIGIRVDAVAWSDESKVETITTSGDQDSFRFRRDVTSYLQTNLTGASHSVQVALQFGALVTINHSARLVITYSYDDASASTRTKTACIPLESITGTLTDSLTEIGTSQIPQLTGVGGFIPEAGVTIRDLFFVIMANEGHTSGTTDFSLAVALDAESEVTLGVCEQALDSSPWYEGVWKRTDMDPATTHALRARGTVTGRFPQIFALLYITYTYDHDSSTSILQSLDMPMPTEPGVFGGATSALQSKVSMTVPIPEPGTITLRQSAIVASYNMPNSTLSGLNISVGSQTHRTYSPSTLYNSPAGQQTICHRFDSGAAVGGGVTLVHGENEIALAWYRTSTGSGGAGYGWNARLILNYVSGKHADGAGAHTHTVKLWGGGTDAVGAGTVRDYTFAPAIPETAYWASCVGLEIDYLQAGRGMLGFLAERLSGEAHGDGWETLHVNGFCVSNETSVNTLWCNASAHFFRHPDDPDPNRLELEVSRTWRMSSFLDGTNSHGGFASFVASITYHTITYPVSGASTGYDGDGSGITVHVREADTGDALYQATTTAGGGYSFTAYSDTRELYAEAEQDTTHVARSANFTPS